MAKQAKKSTKKIGGPFIAVAVFCESIVEDSSGKIGAVGILDGCQLYLTGDAPANVPSEEVPLTVTQNILIVFRSGDSPGEHKLKFVIEHPNGKRKIAVEKDVVLSQPPQGGLNLRTNAIIQVVAGGLHWLDIFLDNKRLTRMPLMIEILRLPLPATVVK
jgi:hypothetical protein